MHQLVEPLCTRVCGYTEELGIVACVLDVLAGVNCQPKVRIYDCEWLREQVCATEDNNTRDKS